MISMKRYLYSAIFLLAVLNHTAFSKKQFGCNFVDDHFGLVQNNTFDAQFGNTLKPMSLAGWDHFENVSKVLEFWRSFTLKTHPYDNVDDLIRFYDGYRNVAQQEHLAHYFNRYKPQFIPEISDYGLCIKFLESVSQEIPDAADHMYLITVYSNIPEHELKNLTRRDHFSQFFRHSSTAVVLKVAIEDLEGYFLFHPSIGMSKIVQLMRHVNKPTVPVKGDYAWAEDRQRYFHYNTIIENPKYIFANTSDNLALQTYLYFVEKPFCSMLDCTVKSSLPILARKTIRRQASGPILSGISFDLEANDLVNMFAAIPDEQKLEINIPLSQIQFTIPAIPREFDQDFFRILNALNLQEKAEIVEKQLQIIKALSIDSTFRSDLKILERSLDTKRKAYLNQS